MGDDPPLIDFRKHPIYRLIYDDVINHPFRDKLCALHGSVIVRGGSIISIGLNEPGKCGFSETYAYHKGYTCHSELTAIKRVRRKIDLSGCNMYNLRINKHGIVATSKPCPGCEEMLVNYGFKKCFYSTENQTIEVMKLSKMREVAA